MAPTHENKAGVKNGTKRMAFAVFSILLEVLFIVMIFTRLNSYAAWINAGTVIFAAVLVLAIYGQHTTSSMKTPWIILILTVPVLGICLYLLIGLNGSTRKMRKRYEEIDARLFPKLHEKSDASVLRRFSEVYPALGGVARYLSGHCGYPLYDDTDIEYFPEAADGLAAQKEELIKAKQYIFMEYHAIEDAESWHGIQTILEQKVREGVEVRVIYDDMGSIGFINTDFVKRLESVGIRCRVFNPFSIGLNVFLNNRDHRKITVIDGKTGFTGGYNIANEYFNLTHPFGYWKDTGIMLKGGAVRSLTQIFLEMWNSVRADDRDDLNFDRYMAEVPHIAGERAFVQPYADTPLDREQCGENVYISIAEGAQNYAWFITPYLILTDEMIDLFL